MFPYRCGLAVFIMLVACSTPGLNEKALPAQHDGRASTSIEKLAPALRIEIDKRISGGHPEGAIEILIRTAGPIDQAQRRELEKKGCEIRSLLGNIATARAPARNILDIAGLEYITYMDIAKRLYLK